MSLAMPHLLFFLAIAVVGCNRQRPSEATSTTELSSVSGARADEEMLSAEIGKGLEERFNVIMLPIGDIEIMGGLSSQVESNDFQQKRFKEGYLNFLHDMRAKGLVSLTEKRQSEIDAIGRMGARTLTVIPTKLAEQHRDGNFSHYTDYMALRIANCKVINIIRSSPYQSPRLSQSEEYRLVLGTYRCTGIPWYQVLDPQAKDQDFKFRAIVKLNPFTKRYSLQAVDWGDPKEDGWKSNNVE